MKLVLHGIYFRKGIELWDSTLCFSEMKEQCCLDFRSITPMVKVCEMTLRAPQPRLGQRSGPSHVFKTSSPISSSLILKTLCSIYWWIRIYINLLTYYKMHSFNEFWQMNIPVQPSPPSRQNISIILQHPLESFSQFIPISQHLTGTPAILLSPSGLLTADFSVSFPPSIWVEYSHSICPEYLLIEVFSSTFWIWAFFPQPL